MNAFLRLFQPLLIRLAIRFGFQYIWDNLIHYLSAQVKRTDNKYDDNLVQWLDRQKQDVESFTRNRLGLED